MSGEDERPVWLAESIAQLESVRVDRPVSAQELRRRSVRRRQRRTRSAALAAIVVAAFGAGAYWNSVGADRSAEYPARPGDTSQISTAQEKMRAYYSLLPNSFATRHSTPQLQKLMALYFTDTALKREAVLEGRGSGDLAATCGNVEATTTFTVDVPRSTGANTVRARVTSDSAPKSIEIEVDFDLRTMRISKWSCPDGS